jgi:hypothetical protein
MKQLSIFFAICLAFAACTDPDKDPLQIADLTKGSTLALRGQSFANTQNPKLFGACDTFKRSNPTIESFDFECDFLSEDQESLSRVIVYAAAANGGARVQVGEVPASSFAIPAGRRYKRGSVSIPLTTILSALGKSATDFATDSYIYMESDLELTGGVLVPASAIANSSLTESAQFFPAHKLLFIARD